MKKKNERRRTTSCWNKAKENERLFVLLERDATAADTIRHWCDLRVSRGLNKATDKQIVKARKTAERIDDIHRGGKYNGTARLQAAAGVKDNNSDSH